MSNFKKQSIYIIQALINKLKETQQDGEPTVPLILEANELLDELKISAKEDSRLNHKIVILVQDGREYAQAFSDRINETLAKINATHQLSSIQIQMTTADNGRQTANIAYQYEG